MYVGTGIKYTLFLSDYKEILFFSTDFRKILNNILLKSVQ